MLRSNTPELMDDPEFAASLRDGFHSELARLNHVLGHTQLILDRLKQKPPQSAIDIGCGEGALLATIRDSFGARVTGVDLYPCVNNRLGVDVIAADAISASLPTCDVAIAVLTVHHLTEEEVVALVRNVARSAKRFLILDLVRHPLPLTLFSIFLRPVLSRLVLRDGMQSIRRSFTPAELRALVVRGLSGTDAVFEQWVSAFRSKQLIDITYRD